jgi:hypothetical protein
MREAAYSSEVFESFYKTSQSQKPEDHDMNSYLPENLKTYREKLLIFYLLIHANKLGC